MIVTRFPAILAALMISFAAITAFGEDAKTDWVRVTGVISGSKATVVWMMKKPPKEGFEGMVIKRRLLEPETSPWHTVNNMPIHPSVVVDVKLEKATSSAEELERLNKKLSERVAISKAFYKRSDEGGLEEIFEKKIMLSGLLKKAGTAVTSDWFWGLGMAAAMDPDYAVFCGTGVIDTGLKADTKYVYGAFPKFKGEALPEKPVHIWNPTYDANDPRLKLTITKVKPGDKSLTIDYTMDAAVLKDVEVDAIAVYRAEAWKGELKFANIGRGSMRLRDGEAKGGYWDSKADPKKEYLYRFVPQTLLGKEHKRATHFHYQPDVKIEPPKPKPDPKPEFPPPKITGSYDQNNRTGKIKWSFSVPTGATLQGFRVHWREGEAGKRELLTPKLLPPDQETYITERLMKIKTLYYYFVTAVLADGREAISEGYADWHEEPIPIPVIHNLKAVRLVKDKHVYLRLTWDHPKGEGLKNVDEYCIYTNFGRKKDELRRLGDVFDFRGTQYDLSVPYPNTRDYKVGVAVMHAVTKRIGSIVSTDAMGVRGRLVPKPINAIAVADSPHKTYTKITWEMPENSPELSGFRIHCLASGNGDQRSYVMADIDQISGKQRSFRVGPLPPYVTHFINIVAFDKDGLESKASDSGRYHHDGRPMTRRNNDWAMDLKSPITEMKAQFRGDPTGPDLVTLSWKLPEIEDDLLGEFVINVVPEEAVTVSLPKKTIRKTLVLPVADGFSGKATFTVQVFTFEGHGFSKESADVIIPVRDVPSTDKAGSDTINDKI